MRIPRRLVIAAGLSPVIFFTVAASGCDTGGGNANDHEQQAQASIQSQYEQAQPLPQLKWSQYRETLIAIERSQANTVQTTSFGFNQGVQSPVWSCPSIGFPIPTTTSLSNPQQENDHGQYGGGNTVVGQMDPNGVYAGNSSGTYVLCVAPDGSKYVQYWEGFVQTLSGPAVWDNATHTVKLTGPSTVQVKTH